MSINAPYSFPKELTIADWKEHTDFTKPQHTGIKGELKKVKKAYDDVAWDKFFAGTVCQKSNKVDIPTDVDPKILDVREEHRKSIEPLRKVLKACASVADKVAIDLKKKKLVSKKNRVQVEAISKMAEYTNIALKDNGVYFVQVMKDFDEQKARLQRVVDMAKQTYLKAMKGLATNAVKLKQNPTVDEWTGGGTKGFYQSLRAVGTTLQFFEKTHPKIVPLRKQWKVISNAGFVPKSDEEIPDKLQIALLLIKDLATIMK